ncbi:MAG: serpin family protein [Gemmatimonadota bacterium]|nr:MAG: serpin family protein [Gemmatimonadota bacterium]
MHSRRRPPTLVLAAAAALAACGDLGPEPSPEPITELPRQLTAAEQCLVAADNRFAFNLFREINAQDTTGGNLFISPLSVGMALGMTYNGAAGTTREAMQQTLELQGMTLEEVNQAYRSLIDLLRDLDPRVEFTLANSIWHRHDLSFVTEFLDRSRDTFDAQVTALDFADPAAASTINAWVDEQTRGRIREIVTPPIDPIAIMFLINAIYFKGDWTQQFDASLTHDAAFQLAGGGQTTVRMMTHDGDVPVRVLFDTDPLLTVADLAYGGQAYSMTIVMPWEASDIETLVAQLDQTRWNGWISALDATAMRVSLPKFTLEYEITLDDVLKALGMAEAFTSAADFTNLYRGPERAFISEVKHKTFVDVNEEGTEAAAVTSVEIGLTSAPLSIYVDRPFLFVIRERLSGTILFVGKMLDPSAS